jgi:hypothetical protein
MTRDPQHPRNPLGSPGMSSRPTIPLQARIVKSALRPVRTVTFNDFPERAHKASQGDPKGTRRSSRSPHGAPKRTKGRTNEGRKKSIGSQRRCMAPRREFKRCLYTQNCRSSAPVAAMLPETIISWNCGVHKQVNEQLSQSVCRRHGFMTCRTMIYRAQSSLSASQTI